MATEKLTEDLTLAQMECVRGENDWGYVYSQGDLEGSLNTIEELLKEAGGKPSSCSLDDLTPNSKKGKAQPEFIITFKNETQTIIVVECKKSKKMHQSENFDKPKDYCVDGVLYYAKFLKKEYNVIAVAISGTTEKAIKVNAFYWEKEKETYTDLIKSNDVILEPENYLKLIRGQQLQKKYSLDAIRKIAIDMHEHLRGIRISIKERPIFIAGILIALSDKAFEDSYGGIKSFDLLIDALKITIKNVLKSNGISETRIEYLVQSFESAKTNPTFSKIDFINDGSLFWYIKNLDTKIKPMMMHINTTLDALGVFYQEFIKYTDGDGKGLGIVLTPQHLTEFMCDVAEITPESKVLDLCCGSGSFLVTAMSKMFSKANESQLDSIRNEGLYGVESDLELYTLAIANMIIRKDGKSNIFHQNCFDEDITKKLKSQNINIGLINPPYSQKKEVELKFVLQLLNILNVGGIAVVVVPMSCAIGTLFKEERKELMEKHRLKAVFSMPDDIFYPTGTNVCVMVWEAKKPHIVNENVQYETFFGYFKDDGFVKRKKLGRIDALNKWDDIQKKWLELYINQKIEDGLSAKQKVDYKSEWLCEAYMNTDYSKLTKDDFQKSISDYLAYLVKFGEVIEAGEIDET